MSKTSSIMDLYENGSLSWRAHDRFGARQRRLSIMAKRYGEEELDA